MQKEAQKSREQFGSRLGFILAAAGSAIGLGNIWKFPFWQELTEEEHLY